MFIDDAIISIHSGKGGDGVVHFRREKYVPYGGPDGGDGGKGGDVIIQVNPKISTLASFKQKSSFQAQNGKNGAKQNMTGHSGEDLVIQVPQGTLIFDVTSGALIADLTQAGQTLVIAKGGKGGLGNSHFANSRNQTPRIAEHGEPSQERHLRLELKLVADVGIVGVPNAGKSTLLATVTNAKPKIADYPFTTLEPNLGVAAINDDDTLILADIPGLIEGAHMGVGLGHDFLKHIQRTRVLIHLLDGLAEDPVLDYAQINSELALFDPGLAEKPQIVALNKIDLPDVQERWPDISKRLVTQFKVVSPLAVSAATGKDLKTLLYRAAELLKNLPDVPVTKEIPVYRLEADPRQYSISHINDGWRVKGEAIERAAAMTYWEFPDSIQRFQRILHALEIDDALRKAGVQTGDSVFIGEYELEWSD